MVLTPLRESHSARGNQRIYAPKGPPEAISPGGPLTVHLEPRSEIKLNNNKGGAERDPAG